MRKNVARTRLGRGLMVAATAAAVAVSVPVAASAAGTYPIYGTWKTNPQDAQNDIAGLRKQCTDAGGTVEDSYVADGAGGTIHRGVVDCHPK
jgi:hypothetical protein